MLNYPAARAVHAAQTISVGVEGAPGRLERQFDAKATFHRSRKQDDSLVGIVALFIAIFLRHHFILRDQFANVTWLCCDIYYRLTLGNFSIDGQNPNPWQSAILMAFLIGPDFLCLSPTAEIKVRKFAVHHAVKPGIGCVV